MMFLNFVRSIVNLAAGVLRWCSGAVQAACVTLAIAIGIPTVAFAATTTLHVDASASSAYPSGPDYGNSWSNAFKYLQDAIAFAVSQTPQSGADFVILVAQGIYKPDQCSGHTAGTRSDSFPLIKYVKIMGGYRGGTGSNAGDYDPTTFIAYLDGDINIATTTTDNSYHVVSATDAAISVSNCQLDGFTIRNGNANGSGTHEDKGGGILLNQAHPKIRGCTITDNAAERGGGIMCLDTATAPEIRNCRITSNTALQASHDGKGAGLDTNYSVTVINTLFQGNSAADWGGGLSVEEAGSRQVQVKMINCQFVGNTAFNVGGGVYVDSLGTLTATNCLFKDNVATDESTDSNGGGLWTAAITLDMVNCTIVHCHAMDGAGGGIAAYPSFIAPGRIVNCIFYGNSATISGTDIEDVTGNSTFSVSYCALTEMPMGGGDYDDDTILILTTSPFVSSTNFELACNSSCIDAGTNSAVPLDAFDVDENTNDDVTTPDLNLLHRNVSGLASSSILPHVDIGVYEKQLTNPCSSAPSADIAPVPCTDGNVNIDDLVAVITNWGSCNVYSTFCPGDIVSSHSDVDIDDLVAVITTWSASCSSGYNAGSFTSVQDCMDAATEEYTPHSQDWDEAVQKCVDALCAAQIIDCD